SCDRHILDESVGASRDLRHFFQTCFARFLSINTYRLISVWLATPNTIPKPVNPAVTANNASRGLPKGFSLVALSRIARDSRLMSPSRLTPKPRPMRKRPRPTLPQEK